MTFLSSQISRSAPALSNEPFHRPQQASLLPNPRALALRARPLTPGNGITLAGFKFMTIQANPDEVIGRKGERGVFIIPTTQAILVGEYEGTPAGDGNVVVAKLADYLKSVGY